MLNAKSILSLSIFIIFKLIYTVSTFSRTRHPLTPFQNEELFQYYSSTKSSSADFAFNLPSFIIFTSRSP